MSEPISADITPVSQSDVEDQLDAIEVRWGHPYKMEFRDKMIMFIFEECDKKNMSLQTLKECFDMVIQSQLKGASASYKPNTNAIIAAITGDIGVSVRGTVWAKAEGCGDCHDGVRWINQYRGGRFFRQSVAWCHCAKATKHPAYDQYYMARYSDIERWQKEDDSLVIVTAENDVEQYKNRVKNPWPINGMEPQEDFTQEIPF